jgi:nucleoside-diphosphate-sugar epimerase
MQVILGAGGSIGKDLAKELKTYTGKVRLMSRNPVKVNEDDELFPGNILDPNTVDKAIAGSDVAYLTVGLQYNIKVWQAHWPVIMKNVISACKKNKSKLVFFDNMYLYGNTQLDPMTEESRISPSSKKGKVRALIAGELMNEIYSGALKGQIVRAADFYGPGIENSVLIEAVVKKLKRGKKAQWFCSTEYLHNFTYTPDAAKATAILGNSDKANGQVWHLPTAPPMTMKEWIEKIANEIGAEPKTMIAPAFLITLLGFINPFMKEMTEMLYQYDRNYNFDSSKFETVFNFKPTTVEEAIKRTVHVG